MNRRQFMKEMGFNLFDAFREAAMPFVEKDIRKISRWADMLSGYTFHAVSLPTEGLFAQNMVGAEALIFYREKDRETWSIFSGTCPECRHLLHYISYSERMKCFSCEKEFALAGKTQLTRLPLKREDGIIYVGLPGKDDRHA